MDGVIVDGVTVDGVIVDGGTVDGVTMDGGTVDSETVDGGTVDGGVAVDGDFGMILGVKLTLRLEPETFPSVPIEFLLFFSFCLFTFLTFPFLKLSELVSANKAVERIIATQTN